jgi:hypothetical protein
VRTPSKQRGFNVLELLCVMGCVTIVLGMLGGTTWHVQSSMALRNTAADFLQAVKTARQYAVDHRCRTRIAFREGIFSDDPAVQAIDEERTYRIHAFIIPSSAPGDAGKWVEVGGKLTAHLTEWARVELIPRSESLVGRWLVCELDPKPRQIPDVVKISSLLFDHFNDDERDQFFADNFYTPETVWGPKGVDLYEFENCLSVFPRNYRCTPTDQGPVLLNGELPEKERCTDPFSGESVEAGTFWPGVVQFIRGMDDNAAKELPGIEFKSDGSLASTWTTQLEFSFACAQRKRSEYVVVIDAATGMARIADGVSQ